ncbi:peptidase C65 Otubain-domain-containing protein [Fimicolochytrium jonesii]|uniref:peptidase C65 Otubain-domain-containing protein n=1 Tax=Fimicolochytrium jonesii TaxID=1396493 RepID=UPI0022FDC06A|nr:peptidase C65 Otubain-domain-containing protein [Fimicolochytrium jonesii]KAI8819263.1 peptidase C65 Otubain-domain-containing protein [Fimicolochytrium jonesii]
MTSTSASREHPPQFSPTSNPADSAPTHSGPSKCHQPTNPSHPHPLTHPQLPTHLSSSANAPPPAYDRPTDEEILQYEKAIKAAEVGDTPLIGDVTGFDGLLAEYALSPVFLSKAHNLSSTSTGIRTAKRDGNCFYRAFSFRLCELLHQHSDTPWAKAVVKRAEGTRGVLGEVGYDVGLLEDFWEVFEGVLRPVGEEGGQTEGGEGGETLLEKMRTEYVSDTIVCYLRLVTAAVLKKNRDLFEAFILDSYPSLDLFISSQVEPMNIEADQPHIVAIATALGVTVRIANLDPTLTDSSGTVNYHEIEPLEPLDVQEGKKEVVLLYRPGHYDVLYPRE